MDVRCGGSGRPPCWAFLARIMDAFPRIEGVSRPGLANSLALANLNGILGKASGDRGRSRALALAPGGQIVVDRCGCCLLYSPVLGREVQTKNHAKALALLDLGTCTRP